MKLIVGLGNPGLEYINTRHNVGFLLLDNLATKSWMKSKSNLLNYSWLTSDLELVKPQTFMNESGNAVKYVVKKHNVDQDDLYVIHDDLDIPLGEFKIQFGKGPKDHNGIIDIEDKLGTKNFWRVRIGVDNRPNDNRPMGEEYVLQNFSSEERVVLDRVIKEVCKKLETL